MKINLKILMLSLGILLFGRSQAQEVPIEQQYKTELSKYLQVSGTIAALDAMSDQIVAMINLQVKDTVKAQKLKTALIDRMFAEMVTAMTPIYQKNISLDDLKALNRFFESPEGKRIAAAMPTISKESMEIVQQIMQKILPDIEKIMKGIA